MPSTAVPFPSKRTRPNAATYQAQILPPTSYGFTLLLRRAYPRRRYIHGRQPRPELWSCAKRKGFKMRSYLQRLRFKAPSFEAPKHDQKNESSKAKRMLIKLVEDERDKEHARICAERQAQIPVSSKREAVESSSVKQVQIPGIAPAPSRPKRTHPKSLELARTALWTD